MKPSPSSSQPTSARVLESLVAHGAPLAGWSAAPAPLPLEEAVVRSLGVARLNATVLRVLPALLARRATEFDLAALKSWSEQLGEEASLGFLLDLTSELFGASPLARLRNELVHAQHPLKAEFFFASEADASWRRPGLLRALAPGASG